jgi:hypothetical protein
MNTSFIDQTPSKWESSIVWGKLEETSDPRLADTTVAYMYDLCLKRLSRRSKSLEEDPHWGIQNILLDSGRMPSLKYFLSTYEEKSMFRLHGNGWKLVDQKKLPCSTDSYLFYLYERIASPEHVCVTSKRPVKIAEPAEAVKRHTSPILHKRRKKNSLESLDSIPFESLFSDDLLDEANSSLVSSPSPSISWENLSSSADDILSSGETDTLSLVCQPISPPPPSSPTSPSPSSTEEFVIDHIERMKGNPSKNPKRLLFLVHWAGYETPSWEPYENVKQTFQFYQFIKQKLPKQHFKKLIPRNVLYENYELL